MTDERFVVDDVADDARAAVESLRAELPAVAEVIAEPVVDAPVVEVQDDKTERARDPDGKFAKKPDEPAKVVADAKPADVVADKPLVQKTPEQQAQEQPQANRPPPGFSIKTKSDWDKIAQQFPHLVADISKRETEVNNGFAALKDFQELKPFVERAKSQGQSLSQALTSYVGIDDLFRRDAAGGMVHVAQNLGLSQQQAGELFLRLANQLGAAPTPQGHQTVTAEPGQAPQNGFDPNAFQPLIAQAMQPVTQKLSALEQHITEERQRAQSLRQTEANSVVEQFRADPKHRYYDDVESIVVNLLQTGIVPRSGNSSADLAKAYEQACMMHPEVREALFNERVAASDAARTASQKEAADKARNASRSVTGSPSTAAGQRRPSQRAEGKSYDDDLTEDVTAAVRLVAARA